MRLFIALLSLDFITKQVAEMLAPKNDLFYLIYNQNSAFGAELGDFTKFLIPLMFFPALYFSLKTLELNRLVNPDQKSMIAAIGGAGLLGNYLGRFSESGVVDFLNFQFCVANLADIYQWAAYGLVCYYVYKNKYLAKKSQSLSL